MAAIPTYFKFYLLWFINNTLHFVMQLFIVLDRVFFLGYFVKLAAQSLMSTATLSNIQRCFFAGENNNIQQH